MADTTTAMKHCNIKISLDKADGSLVDISGTSNEVTPSFEVPIEEWRVFGSTGMKRTVGCARDAKYKCKIVCSTAVDEAWHIIKNWWFNGDPGVARSFRIELPDGASGSDRIDQEVILAPLSIPFDAKSGGPVVAEFELQLNGSKPVLSTVP